MIAATERKEGAAVRDVSRVEDGDSQASASHAERQALPEASGPVPAAGAGGRLTHALALALQRASGNSVVTRLVRQEAKQLTDGSRAIGESLASRTSEAALLRQPPATTPAPAAPKPVDPAVAASWHTSVVAPMEQAANALVGVTADDVIVLTQALEFVRQAQGNASTVAGQIRDDPALRGRIQAYFADLRRFGNKLVIITTPGAITFERAAAIAQDAAGQAARLGPRLRPVSTAPGAATSSATSTGIIRALFKTNVTAKLTPIPRQLKPGTPEVAAAALAAVEQALAHMRGLQPTYDTPGTEDLKWQLFTLGIRVSDLKNGLEYLAAGTQPDVTKLAEEAAGIKGRLEAVFPGP